MNKILQKTRQKLNSSTKYEFKKYILAGSTNKQKWWLHNPIVFVYNTLLSQPLVSKKVILAIRPKPQNYNTRQNQEPDTIACCIQYSLD